MPPTASNQQVAELHKELSSEQFVELTAMISWGNFRARFNRGFDVADQGFSKDGYCALPEIHPALANAKGSG